WSYSLAPAWISWLAGGAVGLLVWLAFAALVRRQDQRMPWRCPQGLPLWWRLAWPLSQITGLARWRAPATRRGAQELRERLRLLGVPESAGAAEWRAARCVLAVAGMLAGLPLAMVWEAGWSLLPVWAMIAWLWPAWWLRSALAAR